MIVSINSKLDAIATSGKEYHQAEPNIVALVCRPCLALAIQAMAVETPIPNRAAADRADMP